MPRVTKTELEQQLLKAKLELAAERAQAARINERLGWGERRIRELQAAESDRDQYYSSLASSRTRLQARVEQLERVPAWIRYFWKAV